MSRRDRPGISPASWFWLWTLVGALAYEVVMLLIGQRGGALSHVAWWALGPPYTWRWVAVGAPVGGLLLWAVPHLLWGWGEGPALLLTIATVGAALAVLTLTH